MRSPSGGRRSSAAGPERYALRYVGEKGNLKHPLASPLYADLEGLPPLLIMVGTHEALFDDSSRFAAKAQAAGVEVEFEAIDKMGDYIRARIP
jgi:monoterpene epsilon-lactone hydrolase